jgi:hypothetical protein
VQYGVIDFDLWVLDLKSHHIKQVLKLSRIGHKRATMREPRLHIACACYGARVAPPVAVDVTIARDEHRLAGCVGDADKRLSAFDLSVLVKAY